MLLHHHHLLVHQGRLVHTIASCHHLGSPGIEIERWLLLNIRLLLLLHGRHLRHEGILLRLLLHHHGVETCHLWIILLLLIGHETAHQLLRYNLRLLHYGKLRLLLLLLSKTSGYNLDWLLADISIKTFKSVHLSLLLDDVCTGLGWYQRCVEIEERVSRLLRSSSYRLLRRSLFEWEEIFEFLACWWCLCAWEMARSGSCRRAFLLSRRGDATCWCVHVTNKGKYVKVTVRRSWGSGVTLLTLFLIVVLEVLTRFAILRLLLRLLKAHGLISSHTLSLGTAYGARPSLEQVTVHSSSELLWYLLKPGRVLLLLLNADLEGLH